MKKRYIIEILVWVLIIVFTAIILSGIFNIFIAQRNTYLVYFTDVDGIIEGSPIKFMGITIGHVEKLRYENKKIAVEFLIVKKGVKIPSGSIARVEFTGIAGSKSIEILPPEEKSTVAGNIIAQNPVRVKDVFEFSRGYASVMNSIELAVIGVDETEVHKVLNLVSNQNGEQFDKINNNLEKFSYTMRGADSYAKRIAITEARANNFVENVIKILKSFR